MTDREAIDRLVQRYSDEWDRAEAEHAARMAQIRQSFQILSFIAGSIGGASLVMSIAVLATLLGGM
jgi:hypothetical protein